MTIKPTSQVAILGNCQIESWSKAIRFMYPQAEVILTKYVNSELTFSKDEEQKVRDAQIVFIIQSEKDVFKKSIALEKLDIKDKTFGVPSVYFRGFHPDSVYVYSDIGPVRSVFGHRGEWIPNIAYQAFQNGYSVEDTLTFYNIDMFQKMGYLDEWKKSFQELGIEFSEYGIDFQKWFQEVSNGSNFMWGMNHPDLKAVAYLVELVLYPLLGRPKHKSSLILDYVNDPLSDVVWPVNEFYSHYLGINSMPYFRNGNEVLTFDGYLHGTFSKWKSEGQFGAKYEIVPSQVLLSDLVLDLT